MNKQIQDLENRLQELYLEREPLDEMLLVLEKEYQKINSRIGSVKARLKKVCNETAGE